MELLLIGERYSQNLGDALLCECLANICKKMYPDSVLHELDISGKQGYGYKNEQTGIAKNKKIKSILKKILSLYFSNVLRTYDLSKEIKRIKLAKIKYAIFSGGSLFMDYFALQIFILIKILSWNNIPVIFNCIGLSELKSNDKINLYLLRYAVNHKIVISVTIRDGIDYFKENIFSRTDLIIEKTLDPAFELKDYYTINNTIAIKKIGIGIMDIRSINKTGYITINEATYILVIKCIIKILRKLNLDFEFFTNGLVDDQKYAEYICKILKEKEKMSERPLQPTDIVNNVVRYSRIISFRLHSLIVATSLGIPSIGFIWENKVKEFAYLIGNSYFINFHDDVINQLEKSLKWLLNEKLEVSFPKNIKLTSEHIESLRLNRT